MSLAMSRKPEVNSRDRARQLSEEICYSDASGAALIYYRTMTLWGGTADYPTNGAGVMPKHMDC